MGDRTGLPADLVSRIPELRAFAISLCRSSDQSDDLVQDTLLSAWAHLDRFEEGTNLGAWLTTILRNRFVNLYRKQRQRNEVMGVGHLEGAATIPNQDGWAISTDLGNALAQLPRHQSQAVLLVGADGLSLADAAAVCKCEVGTIKSRVSRGRAHLSSLLADEMGAEPRRSGRHASRRRASGLMPHDAALLRRARAAGHPRRPPAAPAARS
jgi:RNA polymerase sigma-70 factor (ECF subfamily)